MAITRRSFLAALSAAFAATTVPALPALGRTNTAQHVIRCQYLRSLVLLSGDVDIVITDGPLVLMRIGRTTAGMQMLHCDFDGDIAVHVRQGGVIAYHADTRYDDIQRCTSVGLAPVRTVSDLIYNT